MNHTISYRLRTKASGGDFVRVEACGHDAAVADLRRLGLNDVEITEALKRAKNVILWRNDSYTVGVRYEDGGLVHLSIKRNDRETIHDWRDLQEIKNALVGAEREAVEIYPAESRLVDSANQYHLWVLPAGERVPFGFESRFVTDAIPNTTLKQRPFAHNVGGR